MTNEIYIEPEKKFSNYDKAKDYKKKILPLLEEVKRECHYLDIPFFYAAGIKSDEKGVTFDSDILSPSVLSLNLNDNRFVEFMKVMAGFVTEVGRELPEIEFK